MTLKINVRTPPEAAPVGFSDAPPLLQRLYASRGVASETELGRQLNELPAPSAFKGMEAALDLLVTALAEQWRIVVVGDFDADGATSSALALLALRAMGCRQVEFIVPNRFEYGYGLTPEIVDLARHHSPDLLITVDNGISSIAGVEAARTLGMRVLVTDHHLPGAELPAADAIINPNQPGCGFPSKNLAGVGVIFYLLSALRARLRKNGWFEQQELAEPNMAAWLDLVALGTVADVVPLDKINRILVHQGLLRIRAGQARPGILALLEVAGRDHRRIVASDLGFAVGPRLNAAGRLDDMTHGILCLLSEDAGQARQLAAELDQFNRDRRSIETGMQREALAIVERLHLEETALPWGLCLYDESWHQGVVGLLASRIKERFHRPVIAFAPGDGGDLKGSARSVDGLHIRDALDQVAARHPGLLTKFGGHAMAAGLSLAPARLDDFSRAFDETVRELVGPQGLEEQITIDGELSSEALQLDTARMLREAGPWGQRFPEPLFRGTFPVLSQRTVGERHWKLVLASDGEGAGIDAIAFNVENEIREAGASWVDILYRLDVNAWRGRENPQLLVERILDWR